MEELLKMLVNSYKKEHILDDFIEDIVGFEVYLHGEDVFKDVYISRIALSIQTKGYGYYEVDDLDEVEQILWDAWQFQKMLKTEDEMELLTHQVRNHIRGFEENLKKEVLDFYIDHLYDYATAEIRNIVYKK